MVSNRLAFYVTPYTFVYTYNSTIKGHEASGSGRSLPTQPGGCIFMKIQAGNGRKPSLRLIASIVALDTSLSV